MTQRTPWMAALFLSAGISGIAAQAQGTLTGFQLPSGHLHCEYEPADSAYPASVRCDVVGQTFKAPPLADCPLDYGDSISLPATGRPVWSCHGDTILNPAHVVLAYGKTWRKDGIVCASATTGVRCVNRSGHGFELARARYKLF